MCDIVLLPIFGEIIQRLALNHHIEQHNYITLTKKEEI
jgi:hypothetical protein